MGKNDIGMSAILAAAIYIFQILTLPKQFSAFKLEVDKRFDAVDKRFDAVDKRFDAIEKRLDKMDDRFERLEKKMDDNFARINQTLQQLLLYSAPPQWPQQKRVGEE